MKSAEHRDGAGLFKMTMFGIGLILASGVFAISGDFAAVGAYPLATLIGWAITGVGIFSLCMCYVRLGESKPNLTCGLYSYAKAGFGSYIGFASAWGYWVSALLAQVSFLSLFFAGLGYFFPLFGGGNNLLSILTASVIIWLLAFLIVRGINQAVTINVVVVLAKILPILVLIVAAIFARSFDSAIFLDNFTGKGSGMTLLEQIRSTIYITVWIFIGIEGSVVISDRAKSTKVAGKAVTLSFLSMLIIYVLISVLSMGVMRTEDLAKLANPSMAGVMEAVVGRWGAILVNIAVIISVGGALYTYTILCIDSAYLPAKQRCFPTFFAKENKKGRPINAVLVSTLIIQLFLIIIYFNEATFQFCYSLSTSMIMLPYLLSALYFFKILIKGEVVTHSSADRVFVWTIAIISTIFGFWMLYASGMKYILLSTLLYGPGSILYFVAQKQQKDAELLKTIAGVEWLGR